MTKPLSYWERRGFTLLLLCVGWAAGLTAPAPAAADTDVGNIAVVETDATILQPGELFDLNAQTLTFTPQAGGGYTVSVGVLNFDTRLGAPLGLGDDDSVPQPLGFTFPFFGTARTTVFINSNGHLTFGSGSPLFFHFNVGGGVNSLGTDLSAILDIMAADLPRIAVLWQDWNPAGGGGVLANALSDRLIVTWSAVPLFGTTTTATFQVILFTSGIIQMNYQSVPITPGGGYLTGLSPGSLGPFLVTTIDFSQGAASSISAFPNFEPLVQVFGSTTGPLVHISALARRFFKTHTDSFDQIVMFANFTHAMGNAFAFELTTNQTVSGIGLPPINTFSFFGSSGQLQSFLNMNRLGLYPDNLACLQDFTCRIPGNNDSALTLMGQESGHQWLAFVQFDDGGVCSDLLLGRALAHWSFFHDSDASVMEGNSWVDNGDGTFITDEDTLRFSSLDQYIMGLRAPVDVPSFFFIDTPTGTTKTRSSAPQTLVTASGTRKNVTVNDVITCEGSRSPAAGFTGVNTTTSWKQAFILLIQAGTTAPNPDITKIDTIRAAWESYFPTATGGRGTVDTALPTTLAAAILPSSRSVQVPTPATAFATIINAGPSTAVGVGIALATTIPGALTFQTTDPATNAVTGTPNTPVDIPAGGASQSFVIAISPTAAVAPTVLEFDFSGVNTSPVGTISGVNTLLFSASTTPVPDIVALAATLNNDGIVNLASTGVFAVATVNVGAGATITASADTGGATLPVNITLCETDPATGICLDGIFPPSTTSVTTQINANETPTFGIFVTGTGVVPFDPATNRIFVSFKNSVGVTRGSTSVAVRTQ